MRRMLFWLGLLLCLGAPNLMVANKERQLASGRVVYLELAPADPRSLMQGDYMRLAYKLAPGWRECDWPSPGYLLAEVDQRGWVVAWWPEHLPATPSPAAAGQVRIRYKVEERRLKVGTDAYYFPEGQAQRFSKARYGVFRLTQDGILNLTGLADEDFRPL